MAEAAISKQRKEEARHEDLLGQYLKKISQHPLLTDVQEIELARAIEDGEEAAERLKNLRRTNEGARLDLEEKVRDARLPDRVSSRRTCGWWSQSGGATGPRVSPHSISSKRETWG